MQMEHQRIVETVEAAQRAPKPAWKRKPCKHLVLPGVVFLPSEIEQHVTDRHSLSSRAGGFLLFNGLGVLYGAYSTKDMHDSAIPLGLLVLGLLAIACGVLLVRKSNRDDAARDPNPSLRKGLYLLDDGALHLQGDTDEHEAFYPRASIVRTYYGKFGRFQRTFLVTTQDDGDEHVAVVHVRDVRSIIDGWLGT